MKRWYPALVVLCVCHGVAVAEPERWSTATWENDFIANDDSGYTNGIGYSWGYGPVDQFSDDMMPNWLYSVSQWLPHSRDADKTHAVSYRVMQGMWTPDDIEATEIIEDDRPYTGALMWAVNLHSWDEQFSSRYWLSLGAVGRVSGAEDVQKIIHSIIGVNQPNGWDNQLENEPVFVLGTERLHRLFTTTFDSGRSLDVIGMSELMAGTFRSEVGAGVGLRYGRGLARTFPAASLIPGRNVNPLTASLRNEWHLFFNLYARYVFNDITIDGNTFQDSHAVKLRNEQGFVSLGAAWHAEKWGAVISVQESTRLFEERRENTLFASFSVTWRH